MFNRIVRLAVKRAKDDENKKKKKSHTTEKRRMEKKNAVDFSTPAYSSLSISHLDIWSRRVFHKFTLHIR